MGVDPGLRVTGYGIIDVPGNAVSLVEAGIIQPKQNDVIQNRLRAVHKNLSELIVQHTPQVMVLEKLYTHYHHPTTACILGHVRGVICLLCAQHNIALVEHSVRRIRQSITGKGAASKQQTKRMVAHVLGVDESKLTPDAGDALALALGYARMAL